MVDALGVLQVRAYSTWIVVWVFALAAALQPGTFWISTCYAAPLQQSYVSQVEAELRDRLRLTDARLVRTGHDLRVTFSTDLVFRPDGDLVDPESYKPFAIVASILSSYPDSTIEVTVHSDSTGDANYNQDLTQRRAKAVADILVKNSLDDSRVYALGMAANRPIGRNDTNEGRSVNRRIDILVIPFDRSGAPVEVADPSVAVAPTATQNSPNAEPSGDRANAPESQTARPHRAARKPRKRAPVVPSTKDEAPAGRVPDRSPSAN